MKLPAKHKISHESQVVIDHVLENFTPETVKLGSNLINTFSRIDVTKALAGDEIVIDNMIKKAMSRGWIGFTGTPPSHVPNRNEVEEAIEWMRLIRTVSTH